ncbi:nitroreductase family protein [Streptomyces sp. NPDC005813]|uniref:nitroreductase family protein n=1 Tax=Streptomyces sp. NPDC005813 TaxID=3155592 RepID=UPI0033DC0B88
MRRLGEGQGYGFALTNPGPYIDAGTAAATMMLAAHAIGLGSGPVTSFSRVAVATLLALPDPVRPELIICLGHPAAEQPPPMLRRNGTSWEDVIQGDRG